MGIVNFKKFDHSKPAWRNALDNGSELNNSEKKDMVFDLQANREETGEILKELNKRLTFLLDVGLRIFKSSKTGRNIIRAEKHKE